MLQENIEPVWLDAFESVLRRCAREGKAIVDDVRSQTLDVPPWLLARWIAHYGEATARAMAAALSHEPSLDLTVKSDALQWATRLHGEVLPTGTVRTLLMPPKQKPGATPDAAAAPGE